MNARSEPRDDLVTIAAIGLVAYTSADVGHHAVGHGASCLALGGRIRSLSSIFVDCSLTGAAIDLAGPCANLAIGAVALLAARLATHTSASMRLFIVLAAAFNLFWLELQLVFSAATRTDDWAEPMRYFHAAEPVRYPMIAAGVLAYVWTVRTVAAQMAAFALPLARARKIVGAAWLTAGGIACATAANDPHAVAALLRHAVPQSLLLSIGLLFVPTRAARLASSVNAAMAIDFSVPWVVVAALVGVASILLLGPGVAVSI